MAFTLEEIKKALYKQKPSAIFQKANKTGLTYVATLLFYPDKGIEVRFHIPFNDIGDAEFEQVMQAHLLNRYIVLPEQS